jgi:hypothetical protein
MTGFTDSLSRRLRAIYKSKRRRGKSSRPARLQDLRNDIQEDQLGPLESSPAYIQTATSTVTADTVTGDEKGDLPADAGNVSTEQASVTAAVEGHSTSVHEDGERKRRQEAMELSAVSAERHEVSQVGGPAGMLLPRDTQALEEEFVPERISELEPAEPEFYEDENEYEVEVPWETRSVEGLVCPSHEIAGQPGADENHLDPDEQEIREQAYIVIDPEETR